MGNDPLMKRATDMGYIVAWRHRVEHKAGKLLDQEMTYAEAKKKAEEMEVQEPDKVFWAERKPPEFKAH